MELSKELVAWIAEEEAKWAAEVITDINHFVVEPYNHHHHNDNGDSHNNSDGNGGDSANGNNNNTAIIPRSLEPTQLNLKQYCWDHGCNGREFSTKSNLNRHQREYASRSHQVSASISQSKPCCWDHGCNGRQFASNSNLYRHKREHKWKEEAVCPRCLARFTPTQVRPPLRNRPKIPQCWEHGCAGRQFPRYSSLYRHQRYMLAEIATCPSCFMKFSRD